MAHSVKSRLENLVRSPCKINEKQTIFGHTHDRSWRPEKLKYTPKQKRSLQGTTSLDNVPVIWVIRKLETSYHFSVRVLIFYV